MPKKEIISIPGRPAPSVPLSPAVRCGDMVYVSGQGGRNPETNQFGSFKEQCETSLNSITALLKEAGTSIDNVVSVTSWLVRREDYTEYNEIYRKAFPKDPPSRTTAFVNLSNPEMLLEITCIAAIPS